MKNKRSDYSGLIEMLRTLGDPKRVKASAWFFKTGPGEYGEGDKFLGIRVPIQRKVAKQFEDLPFSDIKKLLRSNAHEHRFVALKILVMRYEDADNIQKKRIVDFYLSNIKYINNWDLVDTSAPYILGNHFLLKNKNILYELAKSKSIWKRRIAIISTASFIKQGDYRDTLKIAEILLQDKHDLVHKAVGWMLREIGNRSLKTEIKFLNKYYKVMPRTMLRYAIEKFPQEKRKYYLLNRF